MSETKSFKLGMLLPQYPKYRLETDLVSVARGAEEIGYDGLWAYERMLVPQDQNGEHGLWGRDAGVPWPDLYRSVVDPLVALSVVAAVTSRITIGSAVVLPPLHMPFRLARSLANISVISGGRLIAGVGTGWSVDEHRATAPRPLAERGAALEEFLDMADALWAPDPVTFANESYTVVPSEVGPKPDRRIPVFMGGSGERVLDRIARRADGWMPNPKSAKQIATTLSRLRSMAAGHGRGPDAITCLPVVALFGFRELPETARRPYTGSMDQLVGDLVDLAAAGADGAILTLPHAARNATELLDLAAELHARVRAVGI